jgi:hypothetical protein
MVKHLSRNHWNTLYIETETEREREREGERKIEREKERDRERKREREREKERDRERKRERGAKNLPLLCKLDTQESDRRGTDNGGAHSLPPSLLQSSLLGKLGPLLLPCAAKD